MSWAPPREPMCVQGFTLEDSTYAGKTLNQTHTFAPMFGYRMSPTYKCMSATAIHDGFAVKASQVVRRLEVGEAVELMEGPVVETEIVHKGRGCQR